MSKWIRIGCMLIQAVGGGYLLLEHGWSVLLVAMVLATANGVEVQSR